MYSGALKGIKSNENKVANPKLSLPPGIRAFVSDANRANNSYSLQSLIKNEVYAQFPQPQSLQEDTSLSYGYASSSSDAYDALSPQYHKLSNSLSSGTTEHDGIDSLMAASNQLHEHLKELEVVIHEQLNIVKTSEPSPTDEPPPKEAPTEFMKGSTVYKQLQREGQASLILELRQFIRTLNKGKSYFHKLPENRIVDFIKGNDITWDDFNNNSKKKTFTNPLKKQLKIKYGVAYKLWLKMNWIYNEKIISDSNGIGPTEVNVSEMPIADLSKHRSLIFISEDCTNHAINNGILMEYFSSSKQLFHYLRWTIKMQQIDRYYKIFIVKNTSIDNADDIKHDEQDESNHDYDEYVNGFNNKDKRELVIFNTELHSSYNGDMLYIIGTDNDKQTVKSPKWKMEEFMTSVEIYSKYGILPSKLPLGSRSNSDAFRHYRNQKRSRMQVVTGYLRDIVLSVDIDAFSESEGLADLIILITVMYYDPFYRKHKYSAMRHIPMDKYVKLPQIKTQQKKELHKAEPRQLQFTSYQFYRHILEALDSNDMKHHFLSIVSFDKHKTEYFIDLLLPIKLPTNNYIGIIFRNYIPISICIDCNDMKTKSKLFDASYNIEKYQWMNNNMTRLSILQVPSRDKMLKKMHKHHQHPPHHQQKNQQQKIKQQPPQNQQPPRRQIMNPPLTAQSTQGRHKLVLKEAIMQQMYYRDHQHQHQQMMRYQQMMRSSTSMIRIGMHGMNE